MKNSIFIVQYYRAPMPSCNWCPRISVAYDATTSEIIKVSLNSDAPNLPYEIKAKFPEHIHCILSEIEVSKSQFKELSKRLNQPKYVGAL